MMIYGYHIINLKFTNYRAGDHVTFIHGNVPQLMVICYFFKFLLIYIDHVPGNQIPILLLYFYAPEAFFGAYSNRTVHLSVRPSARLCVRIRVRAITLYCMNGFPYNLAEVFGISRRCVMRKNHAPISKVKVTQAV